MQPKKPVLLVGAGFSCNIADESWGHMPSSANLLTESFRWAKSISLLNTYKIAMEFLGDLWQVKSLDDLSTVDLEECLHLVANPSERVARKYSSAVVYEQLTQLVLRYLAHCDYEMSKIDLKAPDHEGYHNASSFWIYRLGNALFGRPPYAVVSLNWDLLADKAIWEYAVYHEIPLVNCLASMYGFFPKAVSDGKRVFTQTKPIPFKGTVKVPYLLKLHGSSNWFWCTKCQYLRAESTLDAIESVVRFPKSAHHHCPIDGTPLRFAIIPPIWTKSFDWGPFPSIWKFALEALSGADEILIIGVSFRAADIELRTLLRKAASLWKRPPRVSLVGHSVRSRRYVQRVASFLQIPEARIARFRDIRALLGNKAPWKKGTRLTSVAKRR